MKEPKRKIVSVLMAAVLTVSASFVLSGTQPAYSASSLQDKLNQATKDKKAAQQNRKESQAKLDATMAQITQLDNEMELINTEISTLDGIIQETDGKIAEKETEIAEHEARIAEKDAAFCARLRIMDESSSASYIDLLLSSKNISDFVARLETVREITEYDQGIINEMIALKKGVEEKRNQLVSYRDEQKEARSLVQSKQSALNSKISEKTNYMKALEADVKKYEQMENAARAQEESLKRSIAGSVSKGSAGSNGVIKFTGGVFCWPAPSYTYISSEYGYRNHPVYGTKKYHSGMDLAAPGGSPILAAASGVVKFAGWNGGYGNCIILDHGGGIQTLYGHASKLLVSNGQQVSQGQKIALVGTTGTSTGNHLHFEVLNNGSTVNPRSYLGG